LSATQNPRVPGIPADWTCDRAGFAIGPEKNSKKLQKIACQDKECAQNSCSNRNRLPDRWLEIHWIVELALWHEDGGAGSIAPQAVVAK
jgi:hypothetical protein